MAQPPTYPGAQVTLRPVDTTPVQAREDRSGEIMGRAIQGAGQVASQLSQVAAARQDAIDEAFVTGIDAQQDRAFTSVLYGDGQTRGYFSQQGMGAVDAEKDTRATLAKIAGDTSALAKTPQQKAMLARMTQARLAKAESQIGAHAGKEAFSANLAAKTSGAALYAESAAALWASPAEQAGKMAVGLARLAEKHDLQGMSPDERVLDNLEYTSGVHAASLVQMIDADPHAAESYLLRHGGDMTLKARAALTGPIRKAVIDRDAATFTAGLLTSGVATLPGPMSGNPMASSIQTEAAAQGVDPSLAVVVALVESGMSATAANGQSKGIFQLQDARWKEMGGTAANRGDPAAQISLGIKSIKRTTERLAKRLGRPAAPWEVYLAHQQGDAGGPALLTAPPEVSAISVLEGIGVSPRIARLSITGNGGNENTTAGQFVATWRDRFARKAAQGSAAAAGRPSATMTPDAMPTRESVLAMARAASGGDPEREKALVTAGNAAVAQAEAAKRDREQAANDAVQPYLRPGGARSLQDIPASVLAGLSPQTRTSVENHFASGGEFAKSNDATAQTYLSDMIANNPKAFANEDMTKWIGKLTEGTYSSMLTAQRGVRTGKGDGAVKALTINDVMRGAAGVLVRNGLDPKKDKDEIGKLQQVMLDWGDQFIEQNKRRPTPVEVNAALDGYLLQGKSDGGLWGKSIRVFEAGGAKTFKLSIPPAAEKRIKADYLSAKGREPSREELVTMYRALHAAGKID